MAMPVTHRAASVKNGKNPQPMLGLVAVFPREDIPPLRLFRGVTDQAQRAGMRDIEAVDFQNDYLYKRTCTNFRIRDVEHYLMVASARIQKQLDPFSGKSRICWAQSATTLIFEDEDGGGEDILDTLPAEEKTDEDFFAQDHENALREKCAEFLKKVTIKALVRRMKITERQAFHVRKSIFERMRADFEGRTLAGGEINPIDYIPARRTEKSASGRKKAVHQKDLMDILQEIMEEDEARGGDLFSEFHGDVQ